MAAATTWRSPSASASTRRRDHGGWRPAVGERVHGAEALVEEHLRSANGPLWVIHDIGTGKLKRGLCDQLNNLLGLHT